MKTDMEVGSTVSAVRSKRVLIGNGLCPAVVMIKDGKIHQIISGSNLSGDVGCEVSWLALISVQLFPLVEVK